MSYRKQATKICADCVMDVDLALSLLIKIAANNPYAVVRAYEASVPTAANPSPHASDGVDTDNVFNPLEQQCIALIKKGKPMDALRLYKNRQKCRLSDAKRAIDFLTQAMTEKKPKGKLQREIDQEGRKLEKWRKLDDKLHN